MVDRLFAMIVGGVVFYLGWKIGEKIHKKAAPYFAQCEHECQEETK